MSGKGSTTNEKHSLESNWLKRTKRAYSENTLQRKDMSECL